MNKLEKVQFKFYRTKEGEIDLVHYGRYRMGLTIEEIKDYLRARSGKLKVEGLYKKFCKIAGCNTCSMHVCEDCKRELVLLYRHDVLRFADVLFGKTKDTYFD